MTDPVTSDGTATFTPGVSERRGATTTYLHSGLKNADGRTTAGTYVTASRSFDAFGNIASSSGTWEGPFGYAGGFGYQEDASGLKLLGHRYYDPSVGRFLSRDPASVGRNWYGYCDNNPMNSMDASGLVKVVLYWRDASKGTRIGYHASIMVIDNAKGNTIPSYIFQGGPESENPLNMGKLESKSGAWGPGAYGYDKYWDKEQAIVLQDDDSPLAPTVKRLQEAEADIASHPKAYQPWPSRYDDTEGTPYTLGRNLNRKSGNSNSYAHELVRKAGLEKSYRKAVTKKGGTPRVPGWNVTPWR